MDYFYNYRHLRDFMESHKLQKKDLLEALGCNDYVSLNKWLDGKVPVHVTAMLRFCNYYNTPLQDFFCDADGMPVAVVPALPREGSQLSPTDGYGIKEGRGRGIVETHVGERKISSTAQADVVAKGLARQTEQRNSRDTALEAIRNGEAVELPKGTEPTLEESATVTGNGQQLIETILRLQLDHANEIRQIERDSHEREDRIRRECQVSFDAERNRLMDIIERQSTELSKLYQQGKGTEWPPLMAADESTR